MNRVLAQALSKNIRYAGLALVLSLSFILILYIFCPKPELKNHTTYSKAFLDDTGRLLRITLAQDDRYRLHQDLDSISDALQRATVLYEDRHFYSHFGVDFPAIVRAFWQTYITKSRRIGASTITMQVARLRWRIPTSSITGKLEQIVRAIQLTRHYSRRELLQSYFNLAPYGQNIEGIAAASLIYFNKTPDRLTLPEALTLSVVPQNPNKRNPATKEGFENLLRARDSLYQRWTDHYPIETEYRSSIDLPLKVRAIKELPFHAPHFTNKLLNEMSPWKSGMINTTVNMNIQQQLENQIRAYIEKRRSDGINNAAALLVNYKTQEIEAMVGSADFFDRKIDGQVNGTLAKRSPGSALKPFVYALAMDEGIIHPMTMLRDSATRFAGFTPENFDRKFLGPVFAKNALIESRNIPAVDLQARLRSRSFHHFLTQAGVNNLKNASHYGLALALGGGEVTMLELATLYSTLANGGKLKALKQLRHADDYAPKNLLSAESSYLVLDILKNNPPPINQTGHFDFHYKNDIAWKTGTSWAFRDAWAIGISGPYVLAIWVGNFDGTGNASFVGRSAAGPLLFSLLKTIYPDQGWRLDTAMGIEHLNVKKVQVCSTSGDLPSKHCPRTELSWFIPGVSPIKMSNIDRAIPVSKNSGLRTCSNSTEASEMTVYQFWPSDFLQLFKEAGISLKTPPPYAKECKLKTKDASGQIPRILSPSPHVEYALQSNQKNSIPFSASVDADVERLYWFVDDHFAGKVKSGETFHWPAAHGEYIITVVDDSGRSFSSNLTTFFVN